MNPNVMTEGDGRMEIRQEGDRVFVRLVWDGSRSMEVSFLLGGRDAVVVGKSITKAGYAVNKNIESAKAHAMANAYEKAGNPMMAGVLRVEADNILDRPDDWKPIHKPSIGPYTEDNPCVCVNCGEPSRDLLTYDFGEGDEKNCDQRLLT